MRGVRVPALVAGDFGGPPRAVGGWKPEQWAIMAMPETAMDKYHGSVAGQSDVGRARQVSPMEPVAESGRVQRFADRDFLSGVLRANTRHHAASDFRSYYVGHALTCRSN